MKRIITLVTFVIVMLYCCTSFSFANSNNVDIMNSNTVGLREVNIGGETFYKRGNHYIGTALPDIGNGDLYRVYNMNGDRIGTAKIVVKNNNKYTISDYEPIEDAPIVRPM